MQVVRPHYFDPDGRHVIVDALGPSIRSCFEETEAETEESDAQEREGMRER